MVVVEELVVQEVEEIQVDLQDLMQVLLVQQTLVVAVEELDQEALVLELVVLEL
mgnify:CR=1 FL=1